MKLELSIVIKMLVMLTQIDAFGISWTIKGESMLFFLSIIKKQMTGGRRGRTGQCVTGRQTKAVTQRRGQESASEWERERKKPQWNLLKVKMRRRQLKARVCVVPGGVNICGICCEICCFNFHTCSNNLTCCPAGSCLCLLLSTTEDHCSPPLLSSSHNSFSCAVMKWGVCVCVCVRMHVYDCSVYYWSSAANALSGVYCDVLYSCDSRLHPWWTVAALQVPTF